jgi:putative two-component system response regulator
MTKTQIQSAAAILVVDDEESLRRSTRRVLERAGHRCDEAGSTREARERLAAQPFDAVILDIYMPRETGIDLLGDLLADERGIAVLMATGEDDPDIAELATRRGAYGYLLKPFTPNELLIGVYNALSRLKLERQQRNYRQYLEDTVEERTVALRARLEDLRISRMETVHCLATAVERCDVDTSEHSERIGTLSAYLAGRIGRPDVEVDLLRLASPMHDVGKIAIPDSILRKPGPLDEEERAIMQRHAEIGHEILSESSAELLQLAATVALTHHERYDGNGYPHSLAGQDIPVEGRIVAVADVFDALLSDRVYRPAMSRDKAIKTMVEDRGHFDPLILNELLGSVDEVSEIAGT